MGTSTCTSRRGSSPNLLGKRFATMSRMVSTARSGSGRSTKKKSPASSAEKAGTRPAFTSWAPTTMALARACRKISSSWTHRHDPRGDEVAEHGAGTHRGELVAVADEHEPAVRGEGREQAVEELDVDHRGLVDDHGIRLERSRHPA